MASSKTNRNGLSNSMIELFRKQVATGKTLDALPALTTSILDYLPVCAYTCFYDGEKLLIKAISQSIQRLLGYNGKDLVGKKSFRDITVDKEPYNRIPIHYTSKAYKEFACMQMYYAADGNIKLLIDRGFFFYDVTGRLIGTVGVLIDFGLNPGLDIYDYSRPNEDETSLAVDDKAVSICGNIATQSIIMKSIFERIIRLSPSATSVVIYGESGTGKELVARAIHDLSLKRKKPFVPVNCGAIPENLIESAFFGHSKGSFTGADADSQGFLDAANGGTLFLDEVGEMPLSMQVKLLRVLDGYGYSPVGSNKVKKSDFRVICATHRNLEELVEIGLMRADFFYRLKAAEIRLPPLREKREDIPLLVDFFVARHHENNPQDTSVKPIVPEDVKNKFMTYDWPGNVRELQHAVTSYLSLQELDLPRQKTPKAKTEQSSGDSSEGGISPATHNSKEDFERKKITAALEVCSWDINKTAVELGLSRRTLYRRLAKYGLR